MADDDHRDDEYQDDGTDEDDSNQDQYGGGSGEIDPVEQTERMEEDDGDEAEE